MSKMISKYFREQRRYTQTELNHIFDCSEEKTIEVIKRLKEYGVLKAVKLIDFQKDLSDLIEEDIFVSNVDGSSQDCYYVFAFVGVITISGMILKCYPKYILNNDAPLKELKTVLRVLERYNSSKEQIIKLFNGGNDSSSFNLLAVILYLLKDYNENGPYTNTQDVIESNGMGEILWDKTINDTFTIISGNRPYYSELQTIKRVSDDFNYFKRLHECVLSLCSKEIKDTELTELFDEIVPVDVSNEELIDFGETDYILYRIENELNIQFNTQKQTILKTLYAYISQKKSMDDIDSFSMFGTSSFNLVWEDVCSVTFDNKLHTHLNALTLPISLHAGYNPKNELIELIEKPCWKGIGWTEGKYSVTLIPDLITMCRDKFLIFDAKYYNLQMEEDKELKGQPGIESVAKQYLYQLAYQKFIKDHSFSKVSNCFLLPTEGNAVINKGTASLNMLNVLGLEPIQVRLIPANDIFDDYLSQRFYDLTKLML